MGNLICIFIELSLIHEKMIFLLSRKKRRSFLDERSRKMKMMSKKRSLLRDKMPEINEEEEK